MFEKDKYHIVGKVIRTHGYDGSIKVLYNVSTQMLPPDQKFIFIAIHHKPVPFFLLNSNFLDEDIGLFKLEDIGDKESAQQLVGKDILIEKDKVEISALHNIATFIDYEVYDQNDAFYGVVEDIYDNSVHYILKTNYNTESLIPLHEDLIIEIDDVNKRIKLQIAEGLIED